MRYTIFVLALTVGTGAVDYMPDSPVAAFIAVGSLIALAAVTWMERRRCYE